MARRKRKGKGKGKPRRQYRKRKGRGNKSISGTRNKSGMAFVKQPAEFAPDRLFCPMRWDTLFNGNIGYPTGSVYYDSDAQQAVVLQTLVTDGVGADGGTIMAPNYQFVELDPGGQGPADNMNNNRYNRSDIMLNLYQGRRIKSSTIKIDITVEGSDAAAVANNFTIAVFPVMFQAVSVNLPTSPGVTIPNKVQTILQQPFCKFLNYSLTKTGNKPLYNKIHVSKLYGISENQRKVDSNYYVTKSSATIPNQIVWVMALICDITTSSPATLTVPFKGTVQVSTMYEFFQKYPDYVPDRGQIPE